MRRATMMAQSNICDDDRPIYCTCLIAQQTVNALKVVSHVELPFLPVVYQQ